VETPRLTPSVFHPESVSSWLTLLGFGAFHGLNPGMGWLFAVSLGLQEGQERALWRALPPVAVGHLLALVLVAVPLLLLDSVLPVRTVALIAGSTLLAFGLWKLGRWYRHPRWVGMKVSARDLVLWSFLMATGHGAGLMIAPALVALLQDADRLGGVPLALAGLGAHTAALLLVMAAAAWVVYRRVGLGILRTHWINFDLVWAGALILTGGIALATELWGHA
jgi:hypothetical protein